MSVRRDVTFWTDISTEVGLFVAAVAPTHDELKPFIHGGRACQTRLSVCWTARGPMGVLTPTTSKSGTKAKFVV